MKLYFVLPDYYETRPKACMNGWGTTFLNIAADGMALPCHEARMLPNIDLQMFEIIPLIGYGMNPHYLISIVVLIGWKNLVSHAVKKRKILEVADAKLF